MTKLLLISLSICLLFSCNTLIKDKAAIEKVVDDSVNEAIDDAAELSAKVK